MEETTLKQYKGTKTVKAEPMNESVAVEKGFARANKDGHEWRSGYHVQYTNPDGSTYDSWSPKDVFEKSYQVAEDFKDRLIIEANELKVRFQKLKDFMNKKGFNEIAEKFGPKQAALMLSQYHGMDLYYSALICRIELLELESKDKK